MHKCLSNEHRCADTRALRTPPASPPHGSSVGNGGSVGSGGLKRNSADEGSSRSDILMDVRAIALLDA